MGEQVTAFWLALWTVERLCLGIEFELAAPKFAEVGARALGAFDGDSDPFLGQGGWVRDVRGLIAGYFV